MHEWVNTHAKADLSADVRWVRGEKLKSDILFQAEEAAKLALIVESTSDETATKVTLAGFLRGADLDSRSFHLSFPETQETEDIHGYMAKSFVSPKELPLGKRYEIDLVKRTMTHYATEKDDTWWELEDIRPIP
jgi:hypothetical protein